MLIACGNAQHTRTPTIRFLTSAKDARRPSSPDNELLQLHWPSPEEAPDRHALSLCGFGSVAARLALQVPAILPRPSLCFRHGLPAKGPEFSLAGSTNKLRRWAPCIRPSVPPLLRLPSRSSPSRVMFGGFRVGADAITQPSRPIQHICGAFRTSSAKCACFAMAGWRVYFCDVQCRLPGAKPATSQPTALKRRHQKQKHKSSINNVP